MAQQQQQQQPTPGGRGRTLGAMAAIQQAIANSAKPSPVVAALKRSPSAATTTIAAATPVGPGGRGTGLASHILSALQTPTVLPLNPSFGRQPAASYGRGTPPVSAHPTPITRPSIGGEPAAAPLTPSAVARSPSVAGSESRKPTIHSVLAEALLPDRTSRQPSVALSARHAPPTSPTSAASQYGGHGSHPVTPHMLPAPATAPLPSRPGTLRSASASLINYVSGQDTPRISENRSFPPAAAAAMLQPASLPLPLAAMVQQLQQQQQQGSPFAHHPHALSFSPALPSPPRAAHESSPSSGSHPAAPTPKPWALPPAKTVYVRSTAAPPAAPAPPLHREKYLEITLSPPGDLSGAAFASIQQVWPGLFSGKSVRLVDEETQTTGPLAYDAVAQHRTYTLQPADTQWSALRVSVAQRYGTPENAVNALSDVDTGLVEHGSLHACLADLGFASEEVVLGALLSRGGSIESKDLLSFLKHKDADTSVPSLRLPLETATSSPPQVANQSFDTTRSLDESFGSEDGASSMEPRRASRREHEAKSPKASPASHTPPALTPSAAPNTCRPSEAAALPKSDENAQNHRGDELNLQAKASIPAVRESSDGVDSDLVHTTSTANGYPKANGGQPAVPCGAGKPVAHSAPGAQLPLETELSKTMPMGRTTPRQQKPDKARGGGGGAAAAASDDFSNAGFDDRTAARRSRRSPGGRSGGKKKQSSRTTARPGPGPPALPFSAAEAGNGSDDATQTSNTFDEDSSVNTARETAIQTTVDTPGALWAEFERRLGKRSATVADVQCATDGQRAQLLEELGFDIVQRLKLATLWRQQPQQQQPQYPGGGGKPASPAPTANGSPPPQLLAGQQQQQQLQLQQSVQPPMLRAEAAFEQCHPDSPVYRTVREVLLDTTTATACARRGQVPRQLVEVAAVYEIHASPALLETYEAHRTAQQQQQQQTRSSRRSSAADAAAKPPKILYRMFSQQQQHHHPLYHQQQQQQQQRSPSSSAQVGTGYQPVPSHTHYYHHHHQPHPFADGAGRPAGYDENLAAHLRRFAEDPGYLQDPGDDGEWYVFTTEASVPGGDGLRWRCSVPGTEAEDAGGALLCSVVLFEVLPGETRSLGVRFEAARAAEDALAAEADLRAPGLRMSGGSVSAEYLHATAAGSVGTGTRYLLPDAGRAIPRYCVTLRLAADGRVTALHLSPPTTPSRPAAHGSPSPPRDINAPFGTDDAGDAQGFVSCRYHPGEELRLYCQDDEELTCALCASIGRHKRKECVALTAMLEGMREQFIRNEKTVGTQLGRLEAAGEKLRGQENSLRNAAAHSKRSLEARTVGMHAEVDARERLIADQFGNRERQALAAVAESSHRVSVQAESLRRARACLRGLMDPALAQRQKGISQKAADIVSLCKLLDGQQLADLNRATDCEDMVAEYVTFTQARISAFKLEQDK